MRISGFFQTIHTYIKHESAICKNLRETKSIWKPLKLLILDYIHIIPISSLFNYIEFIVETQVPKTYRTPGARAGRTSNFRQFSEKCVIACARVLRSALSSRDVDRFVWELTIMPRVGARYEVRWAADSCRSARSCMRFMKHADHRHRAPGKLSPDISISSVVTELFAYVTAALLYKTAARTYCKLWVTHTWPRRRRLLEYHFCE